MDAVLNWLWQGGVVAATLCVMLVALRRARANVRYTVCWAALLLIAALPALALIPSTTPTAEAILPAQSDAIVSLPDTWWTSTMAILAAWMIWLSTQVMRLMSAVVAIRRARARGRPFPTDLESVLPHWRRVRFDGRPVTVVVSDSLTSAAVLGWGAPVIAVAPSLVKTLDADDLDRVLIHEWAHVQRHDDIINILQLVVRMVAGWHPALWWIDRRLHVEREIACDELTVAVTGAPKSYAECLMKLSTLRGTARAMHAAPAIFTPSGLRARVIKLVSPHRAIPPVWSRILAAAIVLALSLTSLAVAGLTLVEVTVFAQPLVAARTLTSLSLALERPARVAPAATPGTRTERFTRRGVARSSSPQSPKTEQRPGVRQPDLEHTATPPPEPQLSSPVQSSHTPQAEPEPAPTATPAAANVTDTSQTPPAATAKPDANAEEPRTPWSAAAAGGTTLGRKSKDAGVATAGFFTRFAKRVAGSF